MCDKSNKHAKKERDSGLVKTMKFHICFLCSDVFLTF